ncbi:putative pmp22 peroxisomal membrane protein [Operophtera brumata]|uniref:Putative pmp22 peroxisomal membrane protein n=1 Tax=Operophtera brumata TaxID=104452 RepID=A0A0L7KZD9_OPEBR|nr:putative pmp22 peroxisomal membrane protein [Operophtera brumata]
MMRTVSDSLVSQQTTEVGWGNTVIMFALSCMKLSKTSTSSPLKYHSRNRSYFHRGVKFFFKKNLLFTNSITSGGCMALGDMIQQEFEYQSKHIEKRYDWARLGVYDRYLNQRNGLSMPSDFY